MIGDSEAELDHESIPSPSDSMSTPAVRKKAQSPEFTEADFMTPAPIYGDTLCVLGKEEKMTWHDVYHKFTKPEFP